jgi:thiosulfate/3-mercaptopyruvate sulfurtransferase
MRRLLPLILALALAAPALAAPREALLVPTSWLSEHLSDPDLVVLHVGDKATYDAGHIPGARLITLQDISAPPSGTRPLVLEMPDPAALQERLASLGISDRSRIVVYYGRDGIQSATRTVFTLDAAGLGERTVLLDGGYGAWTREGRATSTETPTVAKGALSPLKMRPTVVDADFVRAHLNAPGYAIVDARAPAFYEGAQTGRSAAGPHKAGHIAGARSVPFSSVTTPELKLAPAADLAARFAAAGVKPGDTVVAYCHVGQQATATLFAARTLGFNVLLYDGSFEDWSRKDLPVDGPAPKPAP